MPNCALGSFGTDNFLIGFFNRQRNVRDVDLRSNSLTEQSAPALFAALKVLPRLESLNLCDNSIGDAGYVALADLIVSSRCLRSLCVSFNEIAAGHVFFEAVGKSSLKELVMEGCGVTNRHMGVLAKALKSSQLEVLDLKNNRISDGRSLLESVVEYGRLRKLCLHGSENLVGHKEAVVFLIHKLLREERCWLQHLTLTNVSLDMLQFPNNTSLVEYRGDLVHGRSVEVGDPPRSFRAMLEENRQATATLHDWSPSTHQLQSSSVKDAIFMIYMVNRFSPSHISMLPPELIAEIITHCTANFSKRQQEAVIDESPSGCSIC